MAVSNRTPRRPCGFGVGLAYLASSGVSGGGGAGGKLAWRIPGDSLACALHSQLELLGVSLADFLPMNFRVD